jgi:PKD repeat protein
LDPGIYRIELIGSSNGPYNLHVIGGSGDKTLIDESFTGTISKGEIHDASVNIAAISGLTMHITPPQPHVPSNKPPVASFVCEQANPLAGESTDFNASASYDSDGSITKYAWDFGDLTSGANMVTNHFYKAPGDYKVKLTVTDDKNTDSSIEKRSMWLISTQVSQLKRRLIQDLLRQDLSSISP